MSSLFCCCWKINDSVWAPNMYTESSLTNFLKLCISLLSAAEIGWLYNFLLVQYFRIYLPSFDFCFEMHSSFGPFFCRDIFGLYLAVILDVLLDACITYLFSTLGLPSIFLCKSGSPMYFSFQVVELLQASTFGNEFSMFTTPEWKISCPLSWTWFLIALLHDFSSCTGRDTEQLMSLQASCISADICHVSPPIHKLSLFLCLKSPSLFIHYSYVSSSLLFHHTLLVVILSLNFYRPLGWIPSGSDKIFWLFILSFFS